jgi:hypothetical protein
VKLSVNAIAGFLYLLAAIYIFGIWYVLLYTSNPQGITAIDNLKYFLNEPQYLIYFRGMFVLPFLCLIIAAIFISKWARSRFIALSLFGVGFVIAITSWIYI